MLKKCPFVDQMRVRKAETYENKFLANITQLHQEGRYRQFANLQRERGNFPNVEEVMDYRTFCCAVAKTYCCATPRAKPRG